jgi:CDP-paratose 2-epimerase
VYGLKTVVFRHSSIYGGRQFASFDQGWIGWFCQQALKQQLSRTQGGVIQPFTIAGTGKQVRDLLHADDLVALYMYAYSNHGRLQGDIFNIGGGFANSLSLIELFNVLSELLAMPKLSYVHIPRRASDQDCYIACIDKAQIFFGWKPETPYEYGLNQMLEWTKNVIFL